jgi:hypothetical protein
MHAMDSRIDERELFKEEVARARAMAPGERLLEGPRLFDRACELMKAGIRHRHPDASEDDVLERLRAQLDMLARIEVRHDER